MFRKLKPVPDPGRLRGDLRGAPRGRRRGRGVRAGAGPGAVPRTLRALELRRRGGAVRAVPLRGLRGEQEQVRHAGAVPDRLQLQEADIRGHSLKKYYISSQCGCPYCRCAANP